MAHPQKSTEKWSEMQDSSQESLEVPTKTVSTRTSPVPGAQESARRTPSPHTHATRATTSVSMLASELQIKVRTQLERIDTAQRLLKQAQERKGQFAKDELDDLKQQIDEAQKAFHKEHAHFELTRLTTQRPDQPAEAGSTQPANQQSRLPDISLPKFSGDYIQWPSFFELFSSIVLKKAHLDDVERFYYLKGCLEGEPLRSVLNLPLTGPSLHAAIAQLKGRYENKRQLVQAHLDQHASVTVYQNDPKSLSQLVSTALETKQGVLNIIEPSSLDECMLVHQMCRKLDRSTKERWESSLGSSTEYPSFDRLVEFVTSRVRTLESLAADPTKPAQPKPAAQPSTSRTMTQPLPGSSRSTAQGARALTAATAQQEITYPFERPSPFEQCDSCGEPHYICESVPFKPEVQRMLSTSPHHAAWSLTSAFCTCVRTAETLNASAHSQFIKDNLIIGSNNGIRHRYSRQQTRSSNASRNGSGSPQDRISTPQQLTSQLNLRRHRSSITVIGVGGTKSTETRGVVDITLQSTHSQQAISMQAHVLTAVSTILPSFSLRTPNWPHIRKLRLADNAFLTPRPVDVIIGADFYGRIIKPNIITAHQQHQLLNFPFLDVAQDDQSNLQELLTKFWVQEESPMDIPSTLTPEEEECESHFCATHSRNHTGRYIVRIPLKAPASLLGNSHKIAQRCLQSTLRRLSKDSAYNQLYVEFMKEYEELGHMVKAPDHQRISSREAENVGPDGEMTLPHDASASGGLRVSSDGSTPQTSAHLQPYYLPHHGVLRLDSSTTKLRVVFNGSKATTSSKSVNDLMHTGANLLLNVTDVLIWLRHYHHIFATDITKMYRQVAVHKDDWDLQRILWIDEDRNVIPYQLTTVTYGTKAAPFLATRALMQLVHDEGHRFPLATPLLTHGRYVDDIFGGADSISELVEVAQQLIALCNAGGFPLAKWHATHPELLRAVSSSTQSSAPISFDDCATKLLGIQWMPQTDVFCFSSSSTNPFDPLGFVSPVIVRAKMLLQELWLHKINWDDPLPSQIVSRWFTIREDLNSLAKLSIPRWFNTWSNSTVEIHGFSDASQLAMAAVIYVTVSSPSNNSTTSLVCSKTKVAPLKRLTIPRLELSAALLLAKLTKYVQSTLKVKINATHLWTDSQVSLIWIKSQASRWKDYVRNRVIQIQELTPNAHWRHVPVTSNLADCASRGISTDQLQRFELWWKGPPWMARNQDHWPEQKEFSTLTSELEVRPNVSLFASAQKLSYHWDLIYKYSSLIKLYRLTALCFRFASRLKRKLETPPVIIIPSCDMEKAQLFWIHATQHLYFTSEIKTLNSGSTLPATHPFSRLTAFIDSQRTLRVGGRLTNTALSRDEKHPAILPRDAHLSKIIIEDAHKRSFHGGTQLTLAYIRQRYWIIGGRVPVKSHILRCVVCARQRGIRARQMMGQLPLSRVTPSRPFAHTGVDYAGPITMKNSKGRGSKTIKGWICVFVCFSSSAVHVGVVRDYSTEGFLAAYRRFSSRRGIAHKLYSDCGTNFIGAQAELKRVFTSSSQEHREIASILSADSTQWMFNPPAAPHMGGKWEAVVKSIKYHLRRTIGELLLTFEEFSTLLTQIEAVLNSRLLEPLSDDPDDISALTPGHFLIGSALNTIPEPSLLEVSPARLSKWQLIQQRVQHFWSQWSRHYLQRLQSISKWHHP
ncbi:uncharacterized protein LOC123989070 [Osmia bicornis bicornis]|uniref:uncharacterized protein LOC123989070 n=1 Tax=Osmia bicornis bicornis TaxID=1437191 RepID=UPI001EAF81B1|nr:uncharacterized protein LOC123989070 [Osmia bicornis bicornis]